MLHRRVVKLKVALTVEVDNTNRTDPTDSRPDPAPQEPPAATDTPMTVYPEPADSVGFRLPPLASGGE